jgi:hypothetical protein
MPALAPYIPTKQALLASWLANFSTLISAGPAAYGLVASDATAIAGMNSSFQAAFLLCTSPTTKSASVVAAKNVSLATILPQIRAYAQTIANNPGVSSAAKIALGLNPKTSTPAQITAPTSNPILSVQALGNLTATLRYRDSAASVSVKAKPFGSVVCQLYALVSLTAVTDPNTLSPIVAMTKSPTIVSLSAYAAGSQLYLAARWGTRKQLFSPWSPIISLTVPALH